MTRSLLASDRVLPGKKIPLWHLLSCKWWMCMLITGFGVSGSNAKQYSWPSEGHFLPIVLITGQGNNFRCQLKLEVTKQKGTESHCKAECSVSSLLPAELWAKLKGYFDIFNVSHLSSPDTYHIVEIISILHWNHCAQLAACLQR